MNEMTSYLNCHPEIEKAVLLVGNNYNYSCLKEFIKDSCLKELVLVGSLLKREIDDIFQNLKRDEGNGRSKFLQKNLNILTFKIFMDVTASGPYAVNGVLLRLYIKLKIGKQHIYWPKYGRSSPRLLKYGRLLKNILHIFEIKTLRTDKEPQILESIKNKNSDIELSVIFPMYNVAAYLDQCISSVTAWKAPYIEFLFVNDGSPDNSREIVLKWAEKDSRIKLLDRTERRMCLSKTVWAGESSRQLYRFH